jgi:hypothetical protein
VTETSTPSGAEPALRDLIERLRQMERRREAATPGSSEYIELVGFERALADEIVTRIRSLDRGPDWGNRPDIRDE